MPTFVTPYGALQLERYPPRSDSGLQAIDAADEYLLNQLQQLALPDGAPLLILNDSFGALACALAPHFKVTTSGDSHLAERALRSNLLANGLAADSVNFVAATEPLTGPFAAVLVRVPKVLALLEQQLDSLHSQLAAGAPLLMGAMIKHLPHAAGELVARYIGPYQAQLAVKKARLLSSVAPDIWPKRQPPVAQICYQLDSSVYQPDSSSSQRVVPALALTNLASLFSREQLDIGSRAFLPHLPTGLGAVRVADLGCGNGVLALVCAQANPQAQFTLVDESYMAVASAKLNWQAAQAGRAAEFRVSDGLLEQPAASLDLVLCNPPFHQQQVVGDFIARRMFAQSHQALVAGGELWIVANRHLGYHVRLQQLFGNCTQVAATPKFVILKARR